MKTSDTSYFGITAPLDDSQKDQRSALAHGVGLRVAALFYVVGVLALCMVGLFICGLACVVGSLWLGVTTLRNYKHLRTLCGESWHASLWRKLLWSSWLARLSKSATT